MSKIDEMIELCLSNMDESKRELTKPMLQSYVWLIQKQVELEKLIDDEGLIIEVEKGGRSNPHTVLAENPAVATHHKIIGETANLYAKLMRFMTKAEVEQVDALQEFLITR